MGSILRAADLSRVDVQQVFARANELSKPGSRLPVRPSMLLGLIFLEPSLRTRVGFAAAAARLGWQSFDVSDLRQGLASKTESWEDTLRTVSGYCDAIVVRPGRALTPADLGYVVCPLINGGDTGGGAEHPTQALIDVFAIERLVGSITEVSLAIVGDPTMRVVRSLLGLLSCMPPASIVLVADTGHLGALEVPSELKPLVHLSEWDELEDVDVVYVAGIPHEALPPRRREALLATAERVASLPDQCVLLSPMPVIDEMDAAVRDNDRNRMFDQSDLGLYVRMALLEHVLADSTG